MRTKGFRVGIVLLSWWVLLFPSSVTWAFMEEGTIRMGLITIISGVGSGYGIQMKVGAEIAIDEINKAGGIRVGGKNVKIEMSPYIGDTARVPTQALALARKFTEQDKVLLVFGPTSSGEAEVLFGSLQKKVDDPKDTGAQIVMFSPGARMIGLADISDWAFRNVFLEEKQIDKELGILIPIYKVKTAGVLVQKDDAYCYVMWDKAFKPALEKYGVRVVQYEECLQGDRDFSPQITKLKRANPDIWINDTLYMLTARSLVDAKRLGFKAKVVLGTIGVVDQKMIEAAGDAAEGLIAGSAFHEDAPRAKALVEKFRKITGLPMTDFCVNAYECIYMTKWVIEHTDIKNTPETLQEDRRKFRVGLLKIKDFEGVLSKLTMLPNRETDKESIILVVKGGKFVLWQKP